MSTITTTPAPTTSGTTLGNLSNSAINQGSKAGRPGTGRLIGEATDSLAEFAAEAPAALASFVADASQIAVGALRASALSLTACR